MATLQLRLAAMTTERMLDPPDREIRFDNEVTPSEAAIDAATQAIKAELFAKRDLGFGCLLRANFPTGVVQEIARAAIVAAKKAEKGGEET